MKKSFLCLILLASTLLLNQCGNTNSISSQAQKAFREKHEVRASDNAHLYMTRIFDKVLIYTIPAEFIFLPEPKLSPNVPPQNPIKSTSLLWYAPKNSEFNEQYIEIFALNTEFTVGNPKNKDWLEKIFKFHSAKLLDNCMSDTFSYNKDIENIKISDNYDYETYVLKCNTIIKGEMKNKETLYLHIMSTSGYYLIKWLEISPSTSAPGIDKKKWQNRIQQLLPIQFADSFPTVHPGATVKNP